ncbi:NADPH-dependent FMN reductase [Streptomyces sp. SID4919]|uniref:CE1759 family FMN reductase n=1 Tax=unclassified Streptomyces TaxID=2593676 RepID=UPI00082393BC|nr:MULTISPECIES: CE1759 family FMN reductase [unclassified Streptomyces]MYY13448.1 NADPH-dependent FMN reductase [Streptomyces sp. SID4919]SCK61372.1 FMN reductase [Streptomyces sp. AmelKG-E11A]
MTTKIAIITAGLRDPSSTRLLADRLEASVRAELTGAGDTVESSFVELRPLGRAIIDAMLSGFPTAPLEEAFGTVADADGVIAVTPAFNASFSGLFKSFFDVLPEDTFADMPVLIGASGGTERHSLVLEHALRPMFSYLHAIVSPRGVYAATDDFGSHESGAALGERVDRAAADYARLVQGCGPRRRQDPLTEDLAAMERLLQHDPP